MRHWIHAAHRAPHSSWTARYRGLLASKPSPEDYDRGATVIRLSNRVALTRFLNIPQGRRPASDEVAVSRPERLPQPGSSPKLASASWPYRSMPGGRSPILVPRRIGESDTRTPWHIARYPTSSAFIGHVDPSTDRILVAGDFNLIHGATDSNRLALPARDRSVFARLGALGFEFLGPQYPHGRKANPTPPRLPIDSRNVPTYHTTLQTPETVANQLDYVFASRGFHKGVRVRALNDPDEWGPRDHCRFGIEVDPSR